MKDYEYHKKVIQDVTDKLKELGIDLYLIITAEGCDPMTSFIPGVDTVGSSAFLFTKEGKRLALASSIDAQDVEESGLFDEVVHYDTYDDRLVSMVISLKPSKIALDYSETDPFCDGLTMGKYKKFLKSMGDYPFEICSADLFIPEVKSLNTR